MSVSGSRAAIEIDLDEFERRLRAAGSQPADLEDPLFELARLVEVFEAGSRSAAPPPRADGEERPEPLEDNGAQGGVRRIGA